MVAVPRDRGKLAGLSVASNHGRGLGKKFARAMHQNLGVLFKGFTETPITKSVHVEKLCLVSDRVGRDSISDFTNNLIHGFLLEQERAVLIREAGTHVPQGPRGVNRNRPADRLESFVRALDAAKLARGAQVALVRPPAAAVVPQSVATVDGDPTASPLRSRRRLTSTTNGQGLPGASRSDAGSPTGRGL